MSFNQYGTIFSSNCKPLKLVDQFLYLGSNITSVERDVNENLSKV